jgi:diguanylate cyclase (GGDEF)-like protein/PAS domain S-box-containing protein
MRKPGDSITTAPISVLVIDDDQDDFFIIKDLLGQIQGREYVVEWVSTLAAAREALQSGSHQVYLLDYRLGPDNGIELLQNVQGQPGRRPVVIVLTGMDRVDLDELALSLGAADYLVKNRLQADLLDRTIRHALQRARAQEELQSRERDLHLFKRAIDASASGIIICDARQPDLPMIYVNPAFEQMTGYSADEVHGQNCRILNRKEPDQPALEAIREAIRSGSEGHAILRNWRKDGQMFWNELSISPVRNEAGQITHLVGVQTDISEHVRFEETLLHRATHDLLTGLPNRNQLADDLTQSLDRARRSQQPLCLALLDLDHFKYINDALGHSVGDQIICAVAGRLQQCADQGDHVARIGGDEFAVVLTARPGPDFAARAEQLRRLISEPMQIQGETCIIQPSIGLAFFPADGEDPQTLLRKADLALYRAKDAGRNQTTRFTPEMTERADQRIRLERHLREAVQQEQISVVYQPIVNLRRQGVLRFEALARWRHPELGVISPLVFIALAEEIGLIGRLGHSVLRQACAHTVAMQKQWKRDIRVAVNISTRELQEPGFPGRVERVIRDTGLPAHCLELEITESGLASNFSHFATVLQRLKALGVYLAIDDFGTGYSSLSYLSSLPIDNLKIDRSFVANCLISGRDATICRAIISLAHNLGLRSVAEGVETQAQRSFLEAAGCDELQGYLLGRPIAEMLVSGVD